MYLREEDHTNESYAQASLLSLEQNLERGSNSRMVTIDSEYNWKKTIGGKEDNETETQANTDNSWSSGVVERLIAVADGLPSGSTGIRKVGNVWNGQDTAASWMVGPLIESWESEIR